MPGPDALPADWTALLRNGEAAALSRAIEAALAARIRAPAAAVESVMIHLVECRMPEEALALWRDVAGMAPAFLPGQDLLASLDRAGQRAATLTLLRGVVVPAGMPGQALRLQLAQAFARLGAPDEARAAFADGLAVSPGAAHFAQGLLRQAIAANDAAAIRESADRLIALPGPVPLWLWRFLGLFETGRIQIGPVTLDLPPAVVPPSLMLAFANGRFETAEVGALLADLRPDDRLLDLGAGSGFTAVSAGLACPGLEILAVEANPALIPVIERNLSLNGISAEVLSGIVGATDGTADLTVAPHFPGSTVHLAGPGLPRLRLPRIGIDRLQARFRPTVIAMDIEGAETDVIPALDLSTLRRLVVEFHPDLTGPATMSDLLRRILNAGLSHDRAPERHVHVFARPDGDAAWDHRSG